MQKLAATIDGKFHNVIEKLSDFCDDQLDPPKPSFIVAKMKKDSEQKKESEPKKDSGVKKEAMPKKEDKRTVSVMPPPPEQPFTKRIAQMQSAGSGHKAYGTGKLDDSDKKPTPKSIFNPMGSMKIVHAPIKESFK